MNLGVIRISKLMFGLAFPYMILGVNSYRKPLWAAILFYLFFSF